MSKVVMYYASGEERQQGFETLAAAMEAAKAAPWADGRVYSHPGEIAGYAEGGVKVGEWVTTTQLDFPTHGSGTHFWVPCAG